MPRKSLNEAAIASVPVVKTTRKKVVTASVEAKPVKAAAPRRKAAPKVAVQVVNGSTLAQHALDAREIEERAYLSWIERGCPMGSPDEDWYRAESELIARFGAPA
ncbi:MAG: DUF2934 domain-containing protein [Acidobacteria bacterium]|nr:DUF2934 domain-containing protein [Acidobacteriota bacterium]